jgi:positive regulator of sigma E activity
MSDGLCPSCVGQGVCRAMTGRARTHQSEIEIPLSAPITVSPGAIVSLTVRESSMRQWTICAYAAPLIALLGMIAIGAMLQWPDALVALVAWLLAMGVFRVVTRHARIEIKVRT